MRLSNIFRSVWGKKKSKTNWRQHATHGQMDRAYYPQIVDLVCFDLGWRRRNAIISLFECWFFIFMPAWRCLDEEEKKEIGCVSPAEIIPLYTRGCTTILNLFLKSCKVRKLFWSSLKCFTSPIPWSCHTFKKKGCSSILISKLC